jgi:hypothetical protein
MISNAFKKQMIDNTYKTQLLPVIKDKVIKNSIIHIKGIQNLLLFKIEESLWLRYKYKIYNIDYNINWFLISLTHPIYLIYKYNEDKNFNIHERISYQIDVILERKHDIDMGLDYAEYLEDVHDQ